MNILSKTDGIKNYQHADISQECILRFSKLLMTVKISDENL
jgi:hypothetical protein